MCTQPRNSINAAKAADANVNKARAAPREWDRVCPVRKKSRPPLCHSETVAVGEEKTQQPLLKTFVLVVESTEPAFNRVLQDLVHVARSFAERSGVCVFANPIDSGCTVESVSAMETVGDGKESHPEGGGLLLSDIPAKAVAQEITPTGSLVDSGKASMEPYDDTSLNAQLLEKLNEQFEKQIQLVESDRLDDGIKLGVYADWVNSLRMLNTELVQSLREMQDTCMERMQLMQAAYRKDLQRFGPDVRLKRLPNTTNPNSTVSGEQLISLELSSNYPIVPATDEMLLSELDAKTSIIDKQRDEVADLRKQVNEAGSILEQLRNMTQERDKQLDDKCKEIAILRQQIVSLTEQLQKVKTSTTASIDNRSLISEITDHHDKITQLRKKLKEQEDKLRQANTAIQFRDEVIAQQRQEIKLLNEKPQLQLASNASFYSVEPGDGSPITQQTTTSFSSSSPRSLYDQLGTMQQDSETESSYVQLLKGELSELREQLREKSNRKDSSLVEMEKALLRLRGACEELLQSTGKLSGCGDGWRSEGCDESGAGGCSLRYEDDDDLIEAMRDRCEVLCRQLAASHKLLEQDEGIGSTSTSRLEHSDPIGQREQQQVMLCIEQQLKRLLGGKEHSNNSASESLSSLSLGLDEGCTLQGLIDDLKKEIESKDLVLRDRHGEMERLQQELSNRDRRLNECQVRQESFDGEKSSLLRKIADLEENVDDHSRTIAMLNMEKVKLLRQVEDLKETLQQYRDNLQQTSEEKVAIEDECKNLLVTISNLRVALEETKRNGSSSVSFFSGLRLSQPQPQSYRVSYLHANGKDDTTVVTPSPTITSAAPSTVTGNSVSPVPNPNPAPGGDYWSAIGRALFS